MSKPKYADLHDFNWWMQHTHLSDGEISRKYGWSRNAVRNARHKLGIPSHPPHVSKPHYKYPQLNDARWWADNQHKTLRQLVQEVGCGLNTLLRARRRLQLPPRRKGPKSRYPQIWDADWWSENRHRTDHDIAREIGCKAHTVCRARHHMCIPAIPLSKATHLGQDRSFNLDDEAQQVLVGSLLGDGTVWQNTEYSAYFTIGLSLEALPYLEGLKNFFEQKGLPGSIRRHGKGGRQLIRGREYEVQPSRSYVTRHRKQLLPYRQAWYRRVQGKGKARKIIPHDIRLTPIVLLHWFVQDGSYGYRKLVLCTQGYTEEDVEFLIERLRQDLQLEMYKIREGKNAEGEWKWSIQTAKRSEIEKFFIHLRVAADQHPWAVECYKYKFPMSHIPVGSSTNPTNHPF